MVCKKLGLGSRWKWWSQIEKVEEFWWDRGDLVIFQIKMHGFYVEVEVKEQETKNRMWAIFVYVNIDKRCKREQWEKLNQIRKQ